LSSDVKESSSVVESSTSNVESSSSVQTSQVESSSSMLQDSNLGAVDMESKMKQLMEGKMDSIGSDLLGGESSQTSCQEFSSSTSSTSHQVQTTMSSIGEDGQPIVKVEESVKNESASSASAVEMKDGEVVSSKEQGDVSKEEKAIVKTSDGVKEIENIAVLTEKASVKVEDGEIVSSEQDSAMHEEVKETDCAKPQVEVEEPTVEQIKDESMAEAAPIAVEAECKTADALEQSADSIEESADDQIVIKEDENVQEAATENVLESTEEDSKQPEEAIETIEVVESTYEEIERIDAELEKSVVDAKKLEAEEDKSDTEAEVSKETPEQKEESDEQKEESDEQKEEVDEQKEKANEQKEDADEQKEEAAEQKIEFSQAEVSKEEFTEDKKEADKVNSKDDSSSSSSSDSEDEQQKIKTLEPTGSNDAIVTDDAPISPPPAVELVGAVADINDDIDDDDLPPPPEDLDHLVAAAPLSPVDLPPPVSDNEAGSPTPAIETKSSYAALVTPSGFVSPTDNDRKSFTNSLLKEGSPENTSD